MASVVSLENPFGNIRTPDLFAPSPDIPQQPSPSRLSFQTAAQYFADIRRAQRLFAPLLDIYYSAAQRVLEAVPDEQREQAQVTIKYRAAWRLNEHPLLLGTDSADLTPDHVVILSAKLYPAHPVLDFLFPVFNASENKDGDSTVIPFSAHARKITAAPIDEAIRHIYPETIKKILESFDDARGPLSDFCYKPVRVSRPENDPASFIAIAEFH
ncbi:MAG: hypothetical protein KGI37_09820 [Alphaproteobacteria bacterium]|nr:hypothetical protein [Alphaproteobacteria bacterium]